MMMKLSKQEYEFAIFSLKEGFCTADSRSKQISQKATWLLTTLLTTGLKKALKTEFFQEYVEVTVRYSMESTSKTTYTYPELEELLASLNCIYQESVEEELQNLESYLSSFGSSLEEVLDV